MKSDANVVFLSGFAKTKSQKQEALFAFIAFMNSNSLYQNLVNHQAVWQYMAELKNNVGGGVVLCLADYRASDGQKRN